MPPSPSPHGGRPRLLLYAMYDPSSLDSAPKVRIAMMAAALEGTVDLERIQGGRTERARAALRWLRERGMGSVDAVYVESSTSVATPLDLAFLLWARIRGRPVGIYFRDAYQLHRDLFPVTRGRQRLADLAWRASLPFVRRLASRRFAPSSGLARVLGLRGAVLLPPGTDPGLPELGSAPGHLVAALVAPTTMAGFDRLLMAVECLHPEFPDARLRVISTVHPGEPLPGWVELVSGGRPALPDLLRDARACVIPLPLTRYTELAVPVRLTDLLALGKPIVVTDSAAVRVFLGATDGASDVAILCRDTPGSLAEAIGQLLRDDKVAEGYGARARAFAERPASTWSGRAATVVSALLGQDA